MQERQLRLGDILDDYCTRERRLTNHAVVAMVGAEVKQTRCTTCDTEHEYKHAKVPRQRRKAGSPAALYAQVAANAPKRVAGSSPAGPDNDGHDVHDAVHDVHDDESVDVAAAAVSRPAHSEPEPDDAPAMAAAETGDAGDEDDNRGNRDDEGPVHRPLIRASLPREGQPPPARPIPEFTIRHPGNRPGRFRPRGQRGGASFPGDRTNGNGFGGQRNAGPRQGGGRPPQGAMAPRQGRRHGPGRKRSK